MPVVVGNRQAARAASFSFQDLSAVAKSVLAQAEVRAAQIVSAANEQAREIISQARPAAEQSGFAAGQAAGLAKAQSEAWQQARAQASETLAQLVQALSRCIEEFDSAKHHLLALAQRDLVNLAIQVARRVCRIQVPRQPADAVPEFQQLITLVSHQHDARILVPPAAAQALADLWTKFVSGNPSGAHACFVADAALAPGECRIVAADGFIDASVETQLDRVAAALLGDEVAAEPCETPAPPEAARTDGPATGSSTGAPS